ncbi:hypothetical protein G4B88_018552 [Cannabis sativa]|uniref:Uncharacterized protein n=1 Tax=Cannabis sativa TaxID=3483 RepID=A0A7J6HGG9_CANSA|nr:hypothetical protein G4B88_018552 [Cannabis sativa]
MAKKMPEQKGCPYPIRSLTLYCVRFSRPLPLYFSSCDSDQRPNVGHFSRAKTNQSLLRRSRAITGEPVTPHEPISRQAKPCDHRAKWPPTIFLFNRCLNLVGGLSESRRFEMVVDDDVLFVVHGGFGSRGRDKEIYELCIVHTI